MSHRDISADCLSEEPFSEDSFERFGLSMRPLEAILWNLQNCVFQYTHFVRTIFLELKNLLEQ